MCVYVCVCWEHVYDCCVHVVSSTGFKTLQSEARLAAQYYNNCIISLNSTVKINIVQGILQVYYNCMRVYLHAARPVSISLEVMKT